MNSRNSLKAVTIVTIKNSINSVVFNDGFLYLCRLNDDAEPDYSSQRLYYFGIRNISQKRLAEAAQLQAQCDMVVHIPLEAMQSYKKDDVAIVRGQTYRIESVQEIYTSSPKIAVLTLSKWEMD